MPKIIMNTNTILKEIEATFPFVEMPPKTELTFHTTGCFECDSLREDLEQYRGKTVTGETIRLVHQEMPELSAKGWRWILPHYLRFCLTPEAGYNGMETEFLIYSLGPDLEFEADTLERLSILDRDQVNCLIHFSGWCLNQQYWSEYRPEDINRAINFLTKIASSPR